MYEELYRNLDTKQGKTKSIDWRKQEKEKLNI